jgi:hypothetical protein
MSSPQGRLSVCGVVHPDHNIFHVSGRVNGQTVRIWGS